MARRLQNLVRCQLSLRSWPARLFCLALFVWTAVYTPLHLVLEQHSVVSEPGVLPVHRLDAAFSAGDADHSHGNHQVHSASDHKIRAAHHSQTSTQTSPIALSIVAVFETPSTRFVSLFLVERVNPPGIELAGAILPRAPPVS